VVCSYSLDLSQCQGHDANALGGVYTLYMMYCKQITDVNDLSNSQGITYVSAMGGVHTLDLINCCGGGGIGDVNALGVVHSLDLRSCDGITDVSALGDVHILNLSNCRDIRDVSAFLGERWLCIRLI
jgi:hypothetical protein